MQQVAGGPQRWVLAGAYRVRPEPHLQGHPLSALVMVALHHASAIPAVAQLDVEALGPVPAVDKEGDHEGSYAVDLVHQLGLFGPGKYSVVCSILGRTSNLVTVELTG